MKKRLIRKSKQQLSKQKNNLTLLKISIVFIIVFILIFSFFLIKLIKPLLSPLLTSLTATASSSYYNTPVENAVDGDLATLWRNGPTKVDFQGETGYWIQADIGSLKSIDKIKFIYRYPNYRPLSYHIYSSADNTNFNSVLDVVNEVKTGGDATINSQHPNNCAPGLCFDEITFNIPFNSRYIRLFYSSPNSVIIREFEVYGQVIETCTDNIKNQNEADIDCGGTCAPCANGKTCTQPQDCQSNYCSSGICATAPTCGDNIININEQCDGTNLSGQDCISKGFYTGTLTCNSDCTFNTSQCSGYCGNGIIESSEQCDGTNLSGQTCETQNSGTGTLTCKSDCTFDLSGCSECVPLTCDDSAFDCGIHDNGCGDDLDCGTCNSGYDCISGICEETCIPSNCTSEGYECGSDYDDDCGGFFNCSTCSTGEYCSGGTCYDSAIPCTSTCSSLNRSCGTYTICGNSTNCGTCSSGEICISGKCECSPDSCTSLGVQCGIHDNGCGSSLNCGTCSVGYTCEDGICIRQTTSAPSSDSGTQQTTQEEKSSAWIWILVLIILIAIVLAAIGYFFYKRNQANQPSQPPIKSNPTQPPTSQLFRPQFKMPYNKPRF